MTENQKLLLPYVEARTNDVINDKTSRGDFPSACHRAGDYR